MNDKTDLEFFGLDSPPAPEGDFRSDSFTTDDLFLVTELAAALGHGMVMSFAFTGSNLHPRIALPIIHELMGAAMISDLKETDEDPSPEGIVKKRDEILAKHFGQELVDAAHAQADAEANEGPSSS